MATATTAMLGSKPTEPGTATISAADFKGARIQVPAMMAATTATWDTTRRSRAAIAPPVMPAQLAEQGRATAHPALDKKWLDYLTAPQASKLR